MSAEGDGELADSLSAGFRKVLDLHEEVNNSPLATNDPNYQRRVHDGICKLEQLTKHVSELGVFSVNESIEEVATSNLKYLLLPALLGDFTLRNQQQSRVDVLEVAEIYYKDYISRLNDYQVCDVKLNKDDEEEKDESRIQFEPLIKSAQLRSSKISLYMETKQIDEQLTMLKKLIFEQEHKGMSVDEEVERKFYLKLIHRWLNKAIEEMASIEMEKPMAKMRISMADVKHRDAARKAQSKPLKPIIITRDSIQKKVYGLGYPSIPTVTVDEFVNQKIKDGTLAFNNEKVYGNSLYDWASDPDKKRMQDLSEEEQKERKLERDNPEELSRMRAMDDWKDEHQRGEGNRHNMG